MRFGFVTCVQLGLSCMEAIYDVGGTLALAVTLPDDKAVGKSGRVYLDEFCAKHDIPLLKLAHVNDAEIVSAIVRAEIDWLFIIGWSQIAGREVLAAPHLGVLGMHPTLLPVGRGRAAIPWAILKGLDKTGVSLFKMDEGVDTGPIAAQVEIPMHPTITAKELYQKVDIAHVQLIRNAVVKLMSGELLLTPQDNTKATVWPARTPDDGEIDLDGSVYEAERLVRAVTRPYPGAFYRLNGFKCVVWSAEIISDNLLYADYKRILKFKDGLLLLKDFETWPDVDPEAKP
jgi:methionyl-tRNA formyltransferase